MKNEQLLWCDKKNLEQQLNHEFAGTMFCQDTTYYGNEILAELKNVIPEELHKYFEAREDGLMVRIIYKGELAFCVRIRRTFKDGYFTRQAYYKNLEVEFFNKYDTIGDILKEIDKRVEAHQKDAESKEVELKKLMTEISQNHGYTFFELNLLLQYWLSRAKELNDEWKLFPEVYQND